MMLMLETAESPTAGFDWVQLTDAEFGMSGKFEATPEANVETDNLESSESSAAGWPVRQAYLNQSLPGVRTLRRHSRQA